MLFILVPRRPESIQLQPLNKTAIEVNISYPYDWTTGQCSQFHLVYIGNGVNSGLPEESFTECTQNNMVLTSLDPNALYMVNVTTVSVPDGLGNYRERLPLPRTSWTCK